MKDTHTYTTHNGLTTFTLLSPGNEVVRLFLTIALPLEGKDSLFVAFLGDMLERGSTRFNKDVYEEKLEFLGAQVNIQGAGTHVHISLTSRAVVLKEVLALLVSALKEPLFTEEEIAKVIKEYAQNMREEKDNSRALSQGLFARKLYTEKEEGYIPSIEIRERQLKKIDAVFLAKLHEMLFVSPWVVSVAGDEGALTQAVTSLSVLHKGAEGKVLPDRLPTLIPAQKEFLVVPEKQNIEFFFGNRLPLTLSDEAFLAFSFGLDVLGKRGGFSGRLMSIVREKEGLTYSIYAWILGATARTAGHWQIATFFTPKDAPQGIASTMREIRLIAEKGVTDMDVKRYKELLSNQFRLAHESVSSTLSLYHNALVAGRTPDEVAEYPARIARLTKKAVNEALRTYLKPEAVVITGAGPTAGLVQDTHKKKA